MNWLRLPGAIGTDWRRRRSVEAADAGGAGEQQVLVEGRLHGAGVGGAENGSGLLDVVGDSGAGLEAVIGADAVIVLAAEAEFEQEVARLDGILDIERVLIDVAGGVEREEIPAACQVEGNQPRDRTGFAVKPAPAQRAGSTRFEGPAAFAVRIQADGIERGVGDPEAEVLRQAGLLEIDADLEIVAAGG